VFITCSHYMGNTKQEQLVWGQRQEAEFCHRSVAGHCYD
jgi:hypothetical protein